MGIKQNDGNRRNTAKTSSDAGATDGGSGPVLGSGPEAGGDLSKVARGHCFANGCTNRTTEDRKYCSARCAPYGNWKGNQSEFWISEEKRKKLEEEYEPYGLDGILSKGKRGTGPKKMF
jgi:hypothetical protein